MRNKIVKRKLLEQMAGLSIDHLTIIKECVDEIIAMRLPEIDAKESVQQVARNKGIKLRDVPLGQIEIVVHPVEKKASTRSSAKGSKYFLVAGDRLTLISRKAKADALMRSGANVIAFEDLPDVLKVKAEQLYS